MIHKDSGLVSSPARTRWIDCSSLPLIYFSCPLPSFFLSDPLCWDWVAHRQAGMRLQPDVGRTFSVHIGLFFPPLFLSSLAVTPSPFSSLKLFSLSASQFPTSPFLSIYHSCIFLFHSSPLHISSVSLPGCLKWFSSVPSGISELCSITEECGRVQMLQGHLHGAPSPLFTTRPILHPSPPLWSGSDQSGAACAQGQSKMLTRLSAHSCGSVSCLTCEPGSAQLCSAAEERKNSPGWV